MTKTLIPIVEGQSEVESAGVLLRRLLYDNEVFDLNVARPFRVKRNKVVREEELEKAIAQAEKSRPDAAAILVLLDADDDCPAELGPALGARARVATTLPVEVVLAEMEFEAWFLGAQESLIGVCGISPDAPISPYPQRVRDAKGEVSRSMVEGRRYIAVDDQPALVDAMDLNLAEARCSSFEKLVRSVKRLAHEAMGA